MNRAWITTMCDRSRLSNERRTADELMRMVDDLCWALAEKAERETGIPQEEAADTYKQWVIEGKLPIEFSSSGDRVRLTAPAKAH